MFNVTDFTLAQFTEAVNAVDVPQTRLQEIGLFDTRSMATTSAKLDRVGNTIKLVKNEARTQIRGQKVEPRARSMVSVTAPHLVEEVQIAVDEFQNVRGYGDESNLMVLQQFVDAYLADAVACIVATNEYHRASALSGKVLDSDGSTVVLDLLQIFGMDQSSEIMSETDPLGTIRAVKRATQLLLPGSPIRSFRMLCSPEFFDKFVALEPVKAAWERYQANEHARTDTRQGFSFGGGSGAAFYIEEYFNNVDGKDYIPAGSAYVVPEGVRGLFQTWLAPANYMETLNTLGQPFYAKPDTTVPYDKGMNIDVQSNPLNICTVPSAVFEMKFA